MPAAPVTLSADARQLLLERFAASGIVRPLAMIKINEPATDKLEEGAENDVDWTIKRRDLWTVVIVDRAIRDDDPRIAVVDGVRFISDFFPIRFDISVRDGKFAVAATA